MASWVYDWLNNELATWALPIVDRWRSTVCDCRRIRQLHGEFDAAAAIAAERPNHPLTDAEVGIGGPAPWTILAMWASIAFGIPLAVLVLGASLVWAFSGFAAKRS
jgi:hypothetical protein